MENQQNSYQVKVVQDLALITFGQLVGKENLMLLED
jgi:hypothetical protein